MFSERLFLSGNFISELFLDARVLIIMVPILSLIFSFLSTLDHAYIVSPEKVGAECFPEWMADTLKVLANPLQLIALAKDIM